LQFSGALDLIDIPPEFNASSWNGQSPEASRIRRQFMKRHWAIAKQMRHCEVFETKAPWRIASESALKTEKFRFKTRP
jgi:hypothetical protein